MMKFIGKKSMKSAACFSVLCALGAGLSVSNLHASASGTSHIGDSMTGGGISVDPSKLGFVPYKNNEVSWEGIQNPDTNVNVQLASGEMCDSLGIDIGTKYVEVSRSDATNEKTTILESVVSGKHVGILGNFSKSKYNLLSELNYRELAGKVQFSCDDWVRAFVGDDRVGNKCEFYAYDEAFGYHNFAKVSIRRGWCSTVPPGIMKYVSVNHDEHRNFISATYTRGNVKINLNKEQYARLKSAVEVSALICAMSVYSQYADNGVQAFYDGAVLASKNGKKRTISVTFSDAIQGIEKEIRMRAMEIVFESGGDANNFKEALARISNGNTIFNYKTIHASLAAQTCYQCENAKSLRGGREKVIILDYGHNGLSISGAEHTNGSFTQYPTESYTNCGGKFIDDALVDYFIKKIKEDGEKDGRETIKEEKLRANVSGQVVLMKEKLSALGADTIELTVQAPYKDNEDYSCQYSVDELNTLLRETGVEENFTGAINNYIINHSKELGLIDENGAPQKGDFQIVITGGSLRIPLLQDKATEILKYYTGNNAKITKTLNMDECFANGAACAGFCYKIDGIESDSKKFTGFEENSLKWVRNLCNLNDSRTNLALIRNMEEQFVYYCQHNFEDRDFLGTVAEVLGVLKDPTKSNDFMGRGHQIRGAIAKMLNVSEDSTKVASDILDNIKELIDSLAKASFISLVYDDNSKISNDPVADALHKKKELLSLYDSIVNLLVSYCSENSDDLVRTCSSLTGKMLETERENSTLRESTFHALKEFVQGLTEEKKGKLTEIVSERIEGPINDDAIVNAVLDIMVMDHSYIKDFKKDYLDKINYATIKAIGHDIEKYDNSIDGERLEQIWEIFADSGLKDQLMKIFVCNSKLDLFWFLHNQVSSVIDGIGRVKTDAKSIALLNDIRNVLNYDTAQAGKESTYTNGYVYRKGTNSTSENTRSLSTSAGPNVSANSSPSTSPQESRRSVPTSISQDEGHRPLLVSTDHKEPSKSPSFGTRSEDSSNHLYKNSPSRSPRSRSVSYSSTEPVSQSLLLGQEGDDTNSSNLVNTTAGDENVNTNTGASQVNVFRTIGSLVSKSVVIALDYTWRAARAIVSTSWLVANWIRDSWR